MSKIDDLCLVVNTVSHCMDLWEMFFKQLEKHFPNNKTYVFSDVIEGLPENVTPIKYDINDNFRTQYLGCIKQVEEKFCIYFNEDYILYGDVNVDRIKEYVDFMEEDESISFIKINKNENSLGVKYKERDDLIYLNPNLQHFFSQAVAIWRTRTLEEIHELGPDLHIANLRTGLQFETEANAVCQKMGLQGLYSYNGEPKRGIYHYDNNIFPYIATAIIKGVWNLKEYNNELFPLFIKYGINPTIRGNNK